MSIVPYILSVFASFLPKSKIIDNIMMIASSIIITVIVIFYMRDKLKGQFKNFKENWKSNIFTILKYWICGFILLMATNYIIVILLSGNMAPNEAANRELITKNPCYSIINILLIAPITEELLFRLNFKDVFKKRWTFVLTTGILFGLIHIIGTPISLINFLYIIPYSLLGVAFGLICYDTKSVYSSIIAHMIHNGITLAIILLGI